MAKVKGATPRKQTDGMSLLAAMLVGGVLTLAIGFFLYLVNPFNKVKPTPAPIEKANIQQKVQPTSSPTAQKGNYEFYDLLPEQKITGVPNQAIGDGTATAVNPNITPDVVVNGKTTPIATKATSAPRGTEATVKTVDNPFKDSTKPIKANTDDALKSATAQSKNTAVTATDTDVHRTYILQINSYDNADAADRRRAQVLMAGVDAQIVKNRLQNGIVLYQVISRPMASQQAVAEAQSRLQVNGIDSLIVEQRRPTP